MLRVACVETERWLAAVLLRVPEKRAVDERKLQPLGGVDRDHPHQALIALEPHLRRLVELRRIGHLPREGARQPQRIETALDRARVQQLGEMTKVGEPALAVEIREQSRGHVFMLDDVAHHAHHPMLAQRIVQHAKLRQRRLPGLRILAEPHQVGRGSPEQRGRQRATHLTLITRTRNRMDHLRELACLVGGKHALLPVRHTREPVRGQRFAHQIGLAVLAHDHRDIAPMQRAPLAIDHQARRATPGIGQYRGDVLRGRLRCAPP